jgi:Uma2 family endonuclease
MPTAVQHIPKQLIYEMIEGNPIYYKGYKEYLNGDKQLEELMGSSILQSFLVTKISFLLQQQLGADYEVYSGELGIQFGKNSWRSADIAIFEAALLTKIPLDNKYISVAPKAVIEIDTKAAVEAIENPFDYYYKKTDELLDFGVERVVWILTDSKKVMIAEKNKSKWEVCQWQESVLILNDIAINLEAIIQRRFK